MKGHHVLGNCLIDLILFISLFRIVGTNICSENNGGCQQLCFATSPKDRTCGCATLYALAKDKATCIGRYFSTILLPIKDVTLRCSISGIIR